MQWVMLEVKLTVRWIIVGLRRWVLPVMSFRVARRVEYTCIAK